MRSQLARHGLRRLHAYQATLSARSVLSAPTSPPVRTCPAGGRVARAPQQRRTFFSFLQKPPRAPKAPDVEPGYETLLRFGSHLKDDLRPPPQEEVATAFREFFRFKRFNGRPVNSLQAQVAGKALQYLSQSSENFRGLAVADLRTARDSLVTAPVRDDPTSAMELAKALYLEIQKQLANPSKSKSTADRTLSPEALRLFDMIPLIRTLSQNGRAVEARDHLFTQWPQIRSAPDVDMGRVKGLWTPVLRGLAREGREVEVLAFIQVMEAQAGISYSQAIHEILTRFYAQRNEFDKMKEAFSRPIVPEEPPRQLAYSDALRCAIRQGHRDWAVMVYQDMANTIELLSNPHHIEQAIIILYQFSVLLMGKGPEYIEEMMHTQTERFRFDPNMKIINALVEAATEKQDAYLAERLTSLVFKLRLEPDREFYSRQIDYRMSANDLDGAFASFRSLQNFESDRVDRPVLNKLIRALCAEASPRYERILDITSYLEERHATLEPETVVSICVAFLKNDEQYEVMDTLSLHTIHFSPQERQLVCGAFVDYCLDKSNSTARVWDAYALIRQFFPDVELASRVRIMDAFFDRKRADMAAHVFGHMRQHSNLAYRPGVEVYTRFLEGIGRCPDEESLKLVHNMLKMDTTIDPDTRLYNALMVAYTVCNDSPRALEYWKEISRSREGPSFQTLEIVLRAYEVTPFGDEPATRLWDKMKKMDVDMNLSLYTAYAGVMAAHGHLDVAQKLLENLETEIHERPEPLT